MRFVGHRARAATEIANRSAFSGRRSFCSLPVRRRTGCDARPSRNYVRALATVRDARSCPPLVGRPRRAYARVVTVRACDDERRLGSLPMLDGARCIMLSLLVVAGCRDHQKAGAAAATHSAPDAASAASVMPSGPAETGIVEARSPATPAASRPSSPPAPLRGVAGKVTVRGTTVNAKAGAAVMTDASDLVYLAGVEAWPEAMDGRRINATGKLRIVRSEDPCSDPRAACAAGLGGDQRLLEDAVVTDQAGKLLRLPRRE